MTVSTYYIKTASSAEFWVNKAFAVDGLTTTYMYNSDSFPRVAYLHDTQAPNNLTDVIERMRVRFFVTSAGTLAFDVTETSAWDNNRINEDGSDTFVTASAAWTDWYDLVVTPRGGNSWFLLSEYYAKVVGNEQNIDHVYKIELEVTHEPQPAAGPQLMGYGRNDSDGVNVTSLQAYIPRRFGDNVTASEGDLVFLIGMSDCDGAGGNELSIEGGSGYTKLDEAGDGVSDSTCAVWWKILGVGETSKLISSIDSDEMVTMGIVINAGTFDPDNPINDYSIKAATGTSAYINESGGDDCTTTVDNCLLIGLMATDGSDKLPVTGGTNVGTILEQAIVEDGGNDVGGFLEYKYQATAGVVGDWIRTCQNNDGAATFCIAIAPAPGGSPSPPPLMSLPGRAMRHMIIR